MDEQEWLAGRFEEHRSHLRAVAHRMLGSRSEADDAVQEAWLRLSRTHAGDVENLGGWLTTVVARISLNMLRSRKTRREEPMRRRVRGERAIVDADLDRQREVVDAFLAAAREGNFDALVAVLDPDVVLRAEHGGGVFQELRGAHAVASQAQAYSRLGLVVHHALIDGAVGFIAMRDGRPFSIGGVTVRDGKIIELDFLTDPE